jgi:shikimate kinase
VNQWVLVGHRGVGKTTLLEELRSLFPDFVCASLDSLIVETQDRSIEEIFSQEGEAGFRKIEKECFTGFIKNNHSKNFVLDLGAGFSGQIPSDIKVLWVKRATSSPQNMFLNRPNLDGSLKMDPKRFLQREELYYQISDLSVELREGAHAFKDGEKLFFKTLFGSQKSDGLSHYKWTKGASSTLEEVRLMRDLGVGGVEYRDDLIDHPNSFDSGDIQSFRRQQTIELSVKRP